MIESVAPAAAGADDRVARALALYRSAPLAVRAQLWLRRLLLPLAKVDTDLPREGAILDLACGYGLVSNLLALSAPGREVTGVDLDPARIAIAREAAGDLPNVRFEAGDLTRLERAGCSGVVLLDALHYLTPVEQRDLLARCRRALVAGGTLVLRDAVRERSLRFAWNWAHEAAMVGSALTRTRERRLHFRSRAELLALLEEAGFSLRRIDPPPRHLPYTDTMVVARASIARA